MLLEFILKRIANGLIVCKIAECELSLTHFEPVVGVGGLLRRRGQRDRDSAQKREEEAIRSFHKVSKLRFGSYYLGGFSSDAREKFGRLPLASPLAL